MRPAPMCWISFRGCRHIRVFEGWLWDAALIYLLIRSEKASWGWDMASDEMRKKWGTIFMGEREASVEQLNAMQAPLRKEQQEKGQADDYMERVRARAADRAREILGAAYMERQKVLDEAKEDAEARRRETAGECARLQAEAEAARKLAQTELERARGELKEAEKIRNAAHGEGFQAGMDKAGVELQEFRGELGQSLAALLNAIERQRKNILADWRDQLAELVRCAVEAGTGYMLKNEHEAILRSLVFQALDLLENRGLVTLRVNPADEEQVSDLFRAARERYPELRQWIVTGDASIEAGGVVADSGSGSIELRRENFRQMVDGILCHLGLPASDNDNGAARDVRDIVEREVAHIAGLTPEPDLPPPAESQSEPEPEASEHELEEPAMPEEEHVAEAVEESPEPEAPEPVMDAAQAEPEETGIEEMASAGEENVLQALEDELFPLEEEGDGTEAGETSVTTAPPEGGEEPPRPEAAAAPEKPVEKIDPQTFVEGGFI